ncbi:phage SPO1 DNA polymerase domain protein [Shewanella sp. ANA-3]|uniref:uracil-DNA glycosylase family protein n=1 Tax=Shewanella sp. (strain ANA-3) TaxID=94122 RepID=UPI00005DC8E2|nr:uracil-DNA glycosylase family protein [Shewanella sp. ANA-3]ABK48907.1 phage SPO1 DNA polymerase domain protein [Shewanella sp. ANA-3]
MMTDISRPASEPNCSAELSELLKQIRACQLCQAELPLPAKPILQASSQARILIAGQAPGVKTHHKGIPFDDASGERLRAWLNVSREQFYDPALFAIVPMGFCFPGTIERNGKKQGDKPPRPECAATWHAKLLALMPQIELVLVLGQYAIDYHLPRAQAIGALNSQAIAVSNPQANKKITVTQAIEQWSLHWPRLMVMPHPSPRNNLWLKQHPEFEHEHLPTLQARIADLLASTPDPK